MSLDDTVLTDHNRQDTSLTAPQPLPKGGDGVDIFTLVIEDLKERDALGMRQYGQTLQAGDGRDHLIDLYQELLDAAAYIRQEIEERRKIQTLLACIVRDTTNSHIITLAQRAIRLLGK